MTGSSGPRRRWLAPEVVQTSGMDCGPAALKCLLEGFGVSASYGRLREACQTDVDGTSIDTLETVAQDLGLEAEQVILPEEFIGLDSAGVLPAIAVVRHADGATHFVVVWRRLGRWLQLMDPAGGRRWVSIDRFREDLHRHKASVPANVWREWAQSEACLSPLAERMSALGVPKAHGARLRREALGDPGWFPIAALDAAVRLTASVVSAGGVQAGREAARFLEAVFRETLAEPHDIHALAPKAFWSVSPDLDAPRGAGPHLTVEGGVFLKVSGARRVSTSAEALDRLSPELSAALTERPESALRRVFELLREDGVLAPAVLTAAVAIATGVLILESLLFRGLLNIAGLLALPGQRLAAVGALSVFILVLFALELPILLEAVRYGRQLEVRLRLALLKKLPRLHDRYFQSRPISDMADRGHAIHLLRSVPSMALQALQAGFELLLTLGGVIVIAPDAAMPALGLAAAAIAAPSLWQPLLNERDLRVRNHASGLHSFYLDALVGASPVRTHAAGRSVQRQHEGLLVQWARASRDLARMALLSDAVQAMACTALAGAVLFGHFRTMGGVGGGDLLLIYWTLKLPAIGGRIAKLAQQYPAQRNILNRMLEPLGAPEADSGDARKAQPEIAGAVGFTLRDATVLAGGHEVLHSVDLSVAPGEHVAVVGVSGAGKSSLLGLLLGWNRLAEGELLIDGRTAGAAEIARLRRRTAWVDPTVQIWNRSLLENLEYASLDPDRERLSAAMHAAELRPVVDKLPQGLQAVLGEGGGLLSGGEGQRVRLARAMTSGEVRLALLDEPFRGLGRDRRRALMATVRAWWRDATLVCVTHDVKETLDFPRILVIEDGAVVEDGPPAQLAATPSRYAELLAAEARLRNDVWRERDWRRLTLEGGVLRENASS